MERGDQDLLPVEAISCVSPRKEVKEDVKIAETCNPFPCGTTASCSMFEFPRTCSDLIIYTNSLDSPCDKIQETPDYIRRTCQRNRVAPIELFSERGGDGSKHEWGLAEPMTVLSPEVQAMHRNGCLEASFERQAIPKVQDEAEDDRHSLLSINAGEIYRSVVHGSIDFQKDNFFIDGDIISTNAKVGDGEGLELYRTARYGNFFYKFQTLEAGDYLVDLHLAEIIFTDGPPGMRIFDVFIQEEKVVSGIDIYAQVGSNQPLVLSNRKASVIGNEGLSIRFEGVVGMPLVCGISIRKDSSAGKRFQGQVAGNTILLSGKKREKALNGETEMRGEECHDCKKLKRNYDLLFKEQMEIKRALEEVKRENELKGRECHEAWMSLQELQTELMRKSMHVGSLAFAVEGQVKEKSQWFSSVQDLSAKFKLLKIEHAKLSEEALEYRRCLTDITHMATAIKSTMYRHVDLEREYKDLKLKYTEEARERKDLYNKIVELKGNIRVFCRCRPLNTEEIAAGASMALDFEFAKDGELTVKAHGGPKKVFKFDSVFSPQEDQERVFEKTSPFATSVLDGYNVCIFAYGQTGTGKTFTMEGTEEARGVNYRTLEEIFRVIKERQGLVQYEISVSVLEVYNEQIHDLLLSDSQPGVATKRLEVRQVAEGVHHVPGLVEAHVSNMNEVWEVLQTGSKARAVGSTNANEHSSRSHCIHCVMVRGENLMNGDCTRSKLWLIDLAGSERVAKTDAQGERLKEAQSINKSLSALGDVISALATKSPHIPFRNSKLTHLLQDSLGGDSKTLMFVQVSPNENDVGETLCSLNFASRVRGIELGPAKKQVDGGEVFRYKQMVEKAKQDNKNKDSQIKKMEETIHSLELKNKAKDLTTKNLQDKVKELESQLLIERKLARQHVDTKIAENQLQQQQQQQQQLLLLQEANASSTNHPFTTRPLSEKKLNQVAEPVTGFKEFGHVIRPLMENNSYKPQTQLPDNNIYKCVPLLKDKENKPELAEEPLPRSTSRLSICTTAHRIPIVPAPRRNSLIPFPSVRTEVISNLSPPLPTPAPLINFKDGASDGQNSCHETRITKKFNSILRRSLQKKVIIRSPLQQQIRRGGLEKVRVSIGASGRKARRVLLGNATKADREVQQKRQQKERGWNHGTAARNII